MKTKLIILFLSFNLLGISQIVKMQGKTPQLMNPALTGIFNYGQVNLLTGFSSVKNKSFHYNYVGYSTHFNKINSGIGVNYLYWKDYNPQNIRHNNVYTLSYAHQLQLTNKWSLSVGTSAHYIRNHLEWLINSNLGKFEKEFYDFDLGGFLYSKNFYLGVGVSNILNNLNIISKIDIGYTFKLKDSVNNLTIGTSIRGTSKYGKHFLYFKELVQVMFNHKFLYIGASLKQLGLIEIYGPSYPSFSLQPGIKVGRVRLNYTFIYNGFDFFIPVKIKIYNELSLQIKLPQTLKRKSNAFNHLLY